jgi:hypothetical protein
MKASRSKNCAKENRKNYLRFRVPVLGSKCRESLPTTETRFRPIFDNLTLPRLSQSGESFPRTTLYAGTYAGIDG